MQTKNIPYIYIFTSSTHATAIQQPKIYKIERKKTIPMLKCTEKMFVLINKLAGADRQKMLAHRKNAKKCGNSDGSGGSTRTKPTANDMN